MQASLDRYQYTFGPLSASVIKKMAKELAMWPVVASMLDSAWHEGAPIDDWEAFGNEVQRRHLESAAGDRPRLTVTPSAFDQRVIDYGPQVLNWE